MINKYRRMKWTQRPYLLADIKTNKSALLPLTLKWLVTFSFLTRLVIFNKGMEDSPMQKELKD